MLCCALIGTRPCIWSCLHVLWTKSHTLHSNQICIERRGGIYLHCARLHSSKQRMHNARKWSSPAVSSVHMASDLRLMVFGVHSALLFLQGWPPITRLMHCSIRAGQVQVMLQLAGWPQDTQGVVLKFLQAIQQPLNAQTTPSFQSCWFVRVHGT